MKKKQFMLGNKGSSIVYGLTAGAITKAVMTIIGESSSVSTGTAVTVGALTAWGSYNALEKFDLKSQVDFINGLSNVDMDAVNAAVDAVVSVQAQDETNPEQA